MEGAPGPAASSTAPRPSWSGVGLVAQWDLMIAPAASFTVVGHRCLAASLAFVVATSPFRGWTGPSAAFVPVPCSGQLLRASGIDSSWIRCGSITLPQNRADARAKLAPVVLPVFVVESPSARSRSPVLFLAGGPGEPAIDVAAEIFLNSPVGRLIILERPIIAFNQRGIASIMSGGSPDLGALRYRWRATRDASVETLVDSARLVAARLNNRGIQLANFRTLETVDDVRDVLGALGYDRATLFATSYGTRVALEVMRVHPEIVEAAILDGVAPPQSLESFNPAELDKRRREVAAKIVDDCEHSESCNAEYHQLREDANALDRSDAPPIRIVANVPSAGWYEIQLRGRDLLSAVGAYAGTDFARALPQALEEFAHGDTVRRSVSPELVLHVVHENAVAQTAGPNYPVIYHATLCGDFPTGVLQAGGRGVCEALGVPFSGPEVIAPVSSDIPTLLLSSEYDAQTPPDLADDAARTLPNSYHILFPGVGHLAFWRPASGECVAMIANAFLIDPQRRPADPCSTALQPSFLPRSADLIPTRN